MKTTPYLDTNQPEKIAPRANTEVNFSEIKAQMTATVNKVTLMLTRLERDFISSLLTDRGTLIYGAAERIKEKRDRLNKLIEQMEKTISSTPPS